MLEIINQNRKDNFLKLKNDIYTKPFLDGCNINTIDFISNFKTILDSNGANIKLCNELFNFLRVSLPDSSLNEVVKYCGTNNITRNITDFMCSNNKIISIDICSVNNCMSFHEDTNTLTYCTLCHSRRFTKCSKRNCITKSYDECEHRWKAFFFGKTQALSYQETQKKHVQQSMLPYGLSQTNTHSTSCDSSEHALAHLAEACFIFYCSRVVLDNTSPVQ